MNRRNTVRWAATLVVLTAAMVSAGCGPEISQRWKAPLEITGPVPVGNDLAYLNHTFEEVKIVRPGIDEGGEPFVETVRLATGRRPTIIAASTDESKLFVVNEDEATLSVYDLATLEEGKGDVEHEKVRLGSAYDRITVDPADEFVILSFSGATSQRIVARNLNEVGIVDLRDGVPETAAYTTLYSRAQRIVFAPPFRLGGQEQRLAAALSPSEITIIDLNADDELDRLRSVPLTISQADEVRNPVQVVFDVTENPVAPDTISLYVLTDRGEDVTQIVVQPGARADSSRKFDISVNQLAAGQAPSKIEVLDLPGVGTRLLALDRTRPRFTLVDVTSGEGATFDLPITAPADDMLVYRTRVRGEDRVETRVLAWSKRSPLVAVIRPESIAVSGDAPTVGRTVEAIRAREAPQRILMDRSTDQDRAIAFHAGSQDGFTVFNLHTNRAIPIQGYTLAELTFDGSLGYGVFRDSPHLVRFDLETGHPTVFELDRPGRRIFLNERAGLVVEHAGPGGSFTVLDAREPTRENARIFHNVFFEGLFDRELP